MKGITAFVVDDEPLARHKLKLLISAHEGMTWTGEAAEGESAIRQIDAIKPDLIFLDIQMPRISGLDVLHRLGHSPLVIFTTAYEQYAVTAFELQAVDYLLKPFGKRRFEQAVARLVQSPLRNRKWAESALASEYVSQLYVRERGKIRVIPTERIIRIGAADDYVEVVTEESTHLLSVRMKHLESRLNPSQFVRIHRSWIVQLSWIDEIVSCGNGRHEVLLKDGWVIESSRSGGTRLMSAVR
jgi:two-component system LytT family response regulator